MRPGSGLRAYDVLSADCRDEFLAGAIRGFGLCFTNCRSPSTLLSSAPNTLKHAMCFRTYMQDPLQLEKCTFSAGYLIRVSGACGARAEAQCCRTLLLWSRSVDRGYFKPE